MTTETDLIDTAEEDDFYVELSVTVYVDADGVVHVDDNLHPSAS